MDATREPTPGPSTFNPARTSRDEPTPSYAQSRRGSQRLLLDRVMASDPELGPSPPDGGHGWLVVAATVILRFFIPSLLISYSAVIVRDARAGIPPTGLPQPDASVWNGVPLWVPAFFSAAWSFAAPWSRTLTTARGARMACGCGVLLTSCSLVAAAIMAAVKSSLQIYLMGVAAGLLSGVGCSLVLTSTDFLVRTYFRQQLLRAQVLTKMAQVGGYVIVPMFVLAVLKKEHPFWHVQLAQALLAGVPGLLCVAVLKPPSYGRMEGDDTVAYELLESHSLPPYVEYPSRITMEPEQPTPGPSKPEKETDSDDDDEILLTTTQSGVEIGTSFAPQEPQPLFTDVDLMRTGADNAVFIQDVSDEEVVLYAVNSRVTRYNLWNEVSTLCHPLVYIGSLIVAAARLSNLAYWLLTPTLFWSMSDDLEHTHGLVVVSLAGIVDIAVIWLWPYFRTRHAVTRLRMLVLTQLFVGFTFIVGFNVNSPKSAYWFLVFACVCRLNLSLFNALNRVVLRDLMGKQRFAHSLSFIDMITGLSVLLGTIGIRANYSSVFLILGLINLLTFVITAAFSFCSTCVLRRNNNNIIL